jgi:hypothetical protein
MVFELGEPGRDVAPHTRHVDRASPWPRTHAEAPEDIAIQDLRRRHCASRANDTRRELRPVPCGLYALVSGQTATLHWPPAPPHVATASRPC